MPSEKVVLKMQSLIHIKLVNKKLSKKKFTMKFNRREDVKWGDKDRLKDS